MALNELVDPDDGGPLLDVGEWSREKYRMLQHYVQASCYARRQFPIRTYVDLFSGPGRVRFRESGLVHDGGAVVAVRSASGAPVGAFTNVLLGDVRENYVDACAKRVSSFCSSVSRLNGPADQTVDEVLRRLPGNGLHLVFLDPYNLEHLHFDTIKKLSALRHVDILVHFSVMDLWRNVDLQGVEGAVRFDHVAPGWKAKLDPRIISKKNAAPAFYEYWLELIAGLGFLPPPDEMPLVRDSKNRPLYRLVLLNRHALAKKLWRGAVKSAQSSFNFN